ncbi:MAG: hypothetical protein GC162_20465 [Planctomycetes bacterium]|nr:hypothetical protein [Planctomycetota bacterium]
MFRIGLALAMVIALGVSAEAAPVNLIVNGSFEDFTGGGSGSGGAPANGDLLSALTPTSWTIDDNGGGSNGAFYQTISFGLTAQSGSAFARFNGSNVSISQTFATVVGKVYDVTFYLGTNFANNTNADIVFSVTSGAGPSAKSSPTAAWTTNGSR